MRDGYDAELADVSRILVAMAEAVRRAMSDATTALFTTDEALARRVIAADTVINEHHQQVEDSVYGLLARQAPVASDLRLLVTALHITADLERMGDLAKHVAKVGLRRHPLPAVPESLRRVVADMAAVADRIAAKIGTVLASPDAVDAATLALDDDEMDRLHEALFRILLGASWRDGVEPAVDGAMLARCYERYADHAVNAGRRMYFFVTGSVLHPVDPGADGLVAGEAP
jgi:phosphate transport system protein